MKNMTTQEKIKKIYYYRNYLLEFIKDNIYLELVGGTTRINLHKPQEKVVNDFIKYHHLLFIKSRQIGISTIVQALLVSIVTLYPNITCGVVSKDGAEATDFVRKCKSMIENMPKWIQPKFSKKLEQDFILTNGSRIVAATVNAHKPESCLRGKSLSILVIDEAAFIDKIEEAYKGMSPAVSTTQELAKKKGIPYGTFIISTPNKTIGIGKWYYQRYLDALNGESAFKLERIHWSEVFDEHWYAHQCELLGHDQNSIDQELNMKFVATINSVFSSEIQSILQDENRYNKPYKQKNYAVLIREDNTKEKFEFELEYFTNPLEINYKQQFLIAVDIATKTGACQTVVNIFERNTLDQVAMYVGNSKIIMIPEIIKTIVKKFPNCIIVIERNSYGVAVVEELELLPYYNTRLYFTEKKNNKGEVIKRIPGIETNSFTRPLMMEALVNYVKENYKKIRSLKLAYQLIGLIDKNGKIVHGTGSRDDIVMTLAFASYLTLHNLLPKYTYVDNELLNDMANIVLDSNINDENYNNSDESNDTIDSIFSDIANTLIGTDDLTHVDDDSLF